MKKGAAPEKLVFTPAFNVPLTDTPDTVGSYAITQCDQIHGATDSKLITGVGAAPARGARRRRCRAART